MGTNLNQRLNRYERYENVVDIYALNLRLSKENGTLRNTSEILIINETYEAVFIRNIIGQFEFMERDYF